jgi:hypothetical protein
MDGAAAPRREGVSGRVPWLYGQQLSQHQPPKPYRLRQKLGLSNARDARLVLTCESRLNNFCCSHWPQCDPRGTAKLSCISLKMQRNLTELSPITNLSAPAYGWGAARGSRMPQTPFPSCQPQCRQAHRRWPARKWGERPGERPPRNLNRAQAARTSVARSQSWLLSFTSRAMDRMGRSLVSRPPRDSRVRPP